MSLWTVLLESHSSWRSGPNSLLILQTDQMALVGWGGVGWARLMAKWISSKLGKKNREPNGHQYSLPSFTQWGGPVMQLNGIATYWIKIGRLLFKGPLGGNYLIKDLPIFMNESPERITFSKLIQFSNYFYILQYILNYKQKLHYRIEYTNIERI